MHQVHADGFRFIGLTVAVPARLVSERRLAVMAHRALPHATQLVLQTFCRTLHAVIIDQPAWFSKTCVRSRASRGRNELGYGYGSHSEGSNFQARNSSCNSPSRGRAALWLFGQHATYQPADFHR